MKPFNAKKFHALCQRIAARINPSIKAGAVTPEQVALVASGRERTVSHPVISEIVHELRKEGVRIAN